MFVKSLLHTFLKESLSHRAKLGALTQAVDALIDTNRLVLTSLGRSIKNGNLTKSNINKMDRLIGSENFHNDRKSLFKKVNRKLLKSIEHPVIAIDWSSVHPGTQLQLLCATVCVKGRGVVCYEKLFPKKLYNSQQAHKLFIQGLFEVLPEGCRPIILTDAASSFGVFWFKLISRYNWFWIGRTRRGKQLFSIAGNQKTVSQLYQHSTSRVTLYTQVAFTKSHQLPCNLTVVNKKSAHKKIQKKFHAKRSHRHTTAKHKLKGNDPWVLVSSPNLTVSKEKIVQLYACRMMIEERFRDTKGECSANCVNFKENMIS